MPVTALPSPYGVGTMGKAAREFIQFLKDAKQTCWQILPLNPTSYGDSPYQSFSSFAGNPYLIDLDDLQAEGLLEQKDYKDLNWGSNPEQVDYGLLYQNRFSVLKKAVEKLPQVYGEQFQTFCTEQAEWLDNYALFMALKDAFGGRIAVQRATGSGTGKKTVCRPDYLLEGGPIPVFPPVVSTENAGK